MGTQTFFPFKKVIQSFSRQQETTPLFSIANEMTTKDDTIIFPFTIKEIQKRRHNQLPSLQKK